MICYLLRHGKDDNTRRGGWSTAPLTQEGIDQVWQLAEKLTAAEDMNIGIIYTSDLLRAKQTADILARELSVPVVEKPEFREVNNGVLAGMDNSAAFERYPGLYWNTLEWEKAYPEGESPSRFYHRIAEAWHTFKESLRNLDQNTLLVTHGGVIQVILCLEKGIPYTNRANPFPLGHAEMTAIDI